MHAKKSTGGKLLALLVVMALLIGGAVGGTLAWLIDKTDTVVNTFTAGDINITLTEPNYKPTVDGKAKALPGDKLAKDPTVTVEAGSEDCYVRMFMMVMWDDAADNWFDGQQSAGWYNFNSDWYKDGINLIDETANATKGHVIEFRYKDKVSYNASDDQQLPALFTQITVPTDITGEKYKSLEGATITVIAQAVQSLGSENAAEAFEKAGIPAVVQTAIDHYNNTNPPTN